MRFTEVDLSIGINRKAQQDVESNSAAQDDEQFKVVLGLRKHEKKHKKKLDIRVSYPNF